MRHSRRLPIPQKEFRFAAETFRLFAETGLDGERIVRERAEVEQARRLAEAAQPELATLNSELSHD